MATNRINLNTHQYVRINNAYGQLIIEALAGDIHIVINKNQPAVNNAAFHKLTDRQRLVLDHPDSNVWALGKNEGSQAVITEFSELNGGIGDLTVDAWGIPKVSLPKSLFHSTFTFDIPESLWLMYENSVEVQSSTNIISEDGAGKLVTDATNTYVYLESRECPRYQPNRGHLFSTAVRCPDRYADCEREWGWGLEGENEVAFELMPDGELYAEIMSGGVVTYKEKIDTSVLTDFDVTKNNIYDIQYQWRSAGNFKFYIGDPATGASKLVHEVEYLGTLDGVSIENPALAVHISNERITEDAPLYIGCVDITSENGSVDREVYASAYAEDVSVNATDVPVMVVRQPAQINSQTNTRNMSLARISVTNDKKSTFKVWTTRDATAVVGATFKPVNAGSYVESDSTDMDATAVRATSVDTAKMRFITAVPVEAGVAREIDNPYRDKIEFPIVRGDYLVITCTASTSSADVVVEWGEQL